MALSDRVRIREGQDFSLPARNGRIIVATFSATFTPGIFVTELPWPVSGESLVLPRLGWAAFRVGDAGDNRWLPPFEVTVTSQEVPLVPSDYAISGVALIPSDGCSMDVEVSYKND